MIKSVAIIFILIMPFSMKSQDTTATLGSVTACPPATTMVPLDVTNFIDVGAISLEIGYDTNYLDFISLENVYAPLQGGLLYNTVENKVTVTWSSLSPINLANGKLFDLQFDYLTDSSQLHFDYIEVANSQLQILNVDTIPGGIFHQITITTQPDSIQAYPGSNVNFLVIASGSFDYQWQEDSGNGWTNLVNNSTYSGTNTNLLTINAVPLTFNGNIYRCIITSDDCQNVSDIALLEVAEAFPEATIGTENSCPNEEILVPLTVFDFNDVKEFAFNISFDENVLEFIDLQNVNGFLQNGNLNTTPLTDPNGISVTWDNPSAVNFGETKLFDLRFDFDEDTTALDFIDGTEVINTFGNPVDIDLVNGKVIQYAVPEVTSNPVNDSVETGQDASFSIEALSANAYQWQVSTNNSITWEDLTNDPPYSNVNTTTLLITDVPLSFDGNLYRCRVTGGECTVNSGFARLIVDTATGLNEAIIKKDIFSIYPIPASELLTICNNSVVGMNALISLIDLSGKLLDQEVVYLDSGNNDLDMGNYPDGFYLLTIKIIDNKYNAHIFREKLILRD